MIEKWGCFEDDRLDHCQNEALGHCRGETGGTRAWRSGCYLLQTQRGRSLLFLAPQAIRPMHCETLRGSFIRKFTRIHLAEISSSIAGLHSELLTLTSEQQRGRRANVNKHVRDMTSLHPFIGKQYIYFLCSGDTCE